MTTTAEGTVRGLGSLLWEDTRKRKIRGRLLWRVRSNGLLATFIEQRGGDFRWMSWTFRRKQPDGK